MCGFIVTSKNLIQRHLDDINYFTRYRGPDATTLVPYEGIYFVHNLLDISNFLALQPFINDDIVCLYNGEIYNYKEFGSFNSDGEILLPLYQEFGPTFTKHLDGEFALILCDFKKNILIVSTDIFATKPIWIAFEGNDFGIASYESPLRGLMFTDVNKIPANTTRVYRLDNKNLIDEFTIFNFDLYQHKKSYDDWFIAFEAAVKKRCTHFDRGFFMGLSSGYDSGAIACAMAKYNINFTAYSIIAKESSTIIEQRHASLNNPGKIINLTVKQFDQAKNYLQNNCEEFLYRIPQTGGILGGGYLSDDPGAIGLSYICSQAKAANKKIYFSGQGSDEINGDFGFDGQCVYPRSCFGGIFPNDLKKHFPWHNFYSGSQESYLIKEEYVGGSYGIETRYPHLDSLLVQEFLWLDVKLKNSHYKAPLRAYFLANNFPFDDGAKMAFMANHNLTC